MSNRRSGGRSARRAQRNAKSDEVTTFLQRRLEPVEVLDEAGLQQIEANAELILSEVGVAFQEFPEALDLWRAAGAEVDGDLVKFPPGLCRSLVQATAPKDFMQHARNSARSVQIGGNSTVFAPNYGSPFVTDLDSGRRYATLEDFENVVKITYQLPHLHHSGGTVVEPVDIPVNKRHLDMVYSHLKYSDKPLMGSVTAPERAFDSVELCRIAFGGDLADRTVLTSLINASSPLRWDATMLGAAKVYAENNQACIMSPFILAGAMSPVTVAGLAAQALAEALSGMAFCQLVRPGAPVIFGTFASSMSMATGAPTFGSPEGGLAIYVMAALARRVGVPFRSGGMLTSSKAPDAQAAYESLSTLLPTMQSGVHFVLHAAGWIEGGLALSYEKLVMDADQLGAMQVYANGVDMSENAQALEAFRTNTHGDHFLGNAHTLENFESAFYRSTNADSNSYEQWLEEGSKSSPERANAQWKQMLSDYAPPDFDEDIDRQLRDYIDRRKSEEPDAIG
ncbi:MAG TPA: trimethylamine methyltransferase [Acidimicrobiaceae bacterium]|mgnify:FL=1|nr:trimethylamine methyltransferase family protein [Acidimicrobiales bacterium]HAY65889.1 trimethylamine methyltransferase [Acidimicrobiaceae bacterium]HCK75217.1 trimethylamine methyltransferase [Acidimicrobiaceae bacterium]|tara:strand:- start:1937 stop:3463 length:1527 start_codon:yes stop_codon:yes gene_type:complete